jgi:putative methanogenesis marker protein 8
MTDEHTIEALGMTKVVIRDGRIVSAGEPRVRFCPLAKRMAIPADPITSESVRKNIEGRMERFGMCTENREVLDRESFVLFGASELISTGLQTGFLDAAVIVSDGAGTVIARTPGLVQGIGGRMSGLVETVPYKSVIRRIEDAGGIVIDPGSASMDTLAGLARAKESGWTKVAVTVAGFQYELAEEIRKTYPDSLIIAVHTTGVPDKTAAQRLIAASDLVFACASRYVREAAEGAALLQGGTGVPVFATSKRGKMLVLERLMETDQSILVKNTRLPVGDRGSVPDPLI